MGIVGIKKAEAEESGGMQVREKSRYYVNNLWIMLIRSKYPRFKPPPLGITLWILWITESVFAYYF